MGGGVGGGLSTVEKTTDTTSAPTFVQRYYPAPARPFKRHTVHGGRVNNQDLWQNVCLFILARCLLSFAAW